jgi:hypothetical protein
VTSSAGQAHSERYALELDYQRQILGAVEETARESGGALTAASLRHFLGLTVADVRSFWQQALTRTRFASDRRLNGVPDRIYDELSRNPPRPGSAKWQSLAQGYARTLATSDFGQATLERLAAQGQPAKRWVAHHDSHCRQSHRDIDGTAVALHAAFVVGGFPLQFPGDPGGPPEETYNCRCVLTAASRPSSPRAILSLADKQE